MSGHTALLSRLETAMDVFDDLVIGSTGADKEILGDVDREMLKKLAGKRGFDSEVETLLDAADELELGSDYVDEVEEAADVVDEQLAEIGTDDPSPLTSDQQDELQDAAKTLKDCAAGLLEDVGAQHHAA